MSYIKSLDKYIKDNFPKLLFRMPLFYNSKIGIRFEIGCPNIDYSEKRYKEGVYMRSIMLFEELFYPDTDIYLVVNTHRLIEFLEDENEVKDELKNYVKNNELHSEIEFIELPYIYEDDELITFRYCLSCKVKDINYRRLLKAIGNQDIGIELSFQEEVFFINKNNHIIYNLYDDRGLDIISNKVSTLEAVYLKYNKWILNHDRKRINKIFKK
jgi:hypothetical protein